MRVAMMTREYPPEVYGGAGVHVTELVAQLRHLCEVDVHCMGVPRETAFAHQPDPELADANPALATLSTDLRMAAAAAGDPGWETVRQQCLALAVAMLEEELV